MQEPDRTFISANAHLKNPGVVTAKPGVVPQVLRADGLRLHKLEGTLQVSSQDVGITQYSAAVLELQAIWQATGLMVDTSMVA